MICRNEVTYLTKQNSAALSLRGKKKTARTFMIVCAGSLLGAGL